MAEKSSSSSAPPKVDKEPMTEAEATTLAANFLGTESRIRKLEQELKDLKEKNARRLAAHPYLGNLLGVVRKRASEKKPAPETKGKKRTTEDEEMEGTSPVPKKKAAPEKREAKDWTGLPIQHFHRDESGELTVSCSKPDCNL